MPWFNAIPLKKGTFCEINANAGGEAPERRRPRRGVPAGQGGAKRYDLGEKEAT